MSEAPSSENSDNHFYDLIIYTSRCMFWQEEKEVWLSEGVFVSTENPTFIQPPSYLFFVLTKDFSPKVGSKHCVVLHKVIRITA